VGTRNVSSNRENESPFPLAGLMG